MPYIRKNHLTINEEQEIYEVVEEDGTISWFGSEDELSDLLGTDDWNCGDTVIETGTTRPGAAEFVLSRLDAGQPGATETPHTREA